MVLVQKYARHIIIVRLNKRTVHLIYTCSKIVNYTYTRVIYIMLNTHLSIDLRQTVCEQCYVSISKMSFVYYELHF